MFAPSVNLTPLLSVFEALSFPAKSTRSNLELNSSNSKLIWIIACDLEEN
jgi:hypothetical protein